MTVTRFHRTSLTLGIAGAIAAAAALSASVSVTAAPKADQTLAGKR